MLFLHPWLTHPASANTTTMTAAKLSSIASFDPAKIRPPQTARGEDRDHRDTDHTWSHLLSGRSQAGGNQRLAKDDDDKVRLTRTPFCECLPKKQHTDTECVQTLTERFGKGGRENSLRERLAERRGDI